ncbi:unnamed protein product [Rotaria sp. Silwood2]|nr:unnamed protein product [Rotaria sp. Silwood2]CAF3017387.1 unnamed protein product [Rotaria sp. Silwood2]CAF4052472.1 unnamed protein product [Rotaria sp. Silwood2]CAF4339168.1 unnamed protein product [Rotaria sp. Silwood2]
MSHFYITLHHINPSQVISLTLSNMDDTPGQFQLFFSLFSIKQFIRLESLQLIQPLNPTNLNRILIDILTLESLKSLSIIHCQPSSVNQETFLLFSSLINTSASLRRLYLSGALNTIFHSKITSSVTHLCFNNNIFNSVTLENIVSRMPYLKSLNTAITLNMNYTYLSSPIHLTRLTMTIFININNSDLIILLNKMPSLVFFNITASGKQWFNGNFWEQHLPLTLRTFQFNFCTQSIHINTQIILETFQTPFWLKIKHWYVMLDCQMNQTMTHLYSLPYCDTQFYYRPSMNPTRKFRSSAPIVKPYMNNVKKLTIDFSTLITESSSSLASTHFFSNISTLILVDHGCYSSIQLLLNFLECIIDFTQIVELKLGQFHHPDFIRILYNRLPRLYSLRISETLYSKLQMLDFRNIRSLNICDCLTNIGGMVCMFPSIEYLCVRSTTFEHMRQMIELLGKTLINVTFRHTNQKFQEQIIKWLYEYYDKHRQFSYDIDEHMNLHIWLSDLVV